VTEQELIDWELEQIERARLTPQQALTAQILWTVRNYVRQRGIAKPLTEWNMQDILRAAYRRD
jgi:hypothetical protein